MWARIDTMGCLCFSSVLTDLDPAQMQLGSRQQRTNFEFSILDSQAKFSHECSKLNGLALTKQALNTLDNFAAVKRSQSPTCVVTLIL